MSEVPVDEREERVREKVRSVYTEIAKGGCCGKAPADPESVARAIGYSTSELEAVPEGANLGAGCGNPGALAEMREGDVVLDLGSGAGFDAFLAARAVGPRGRVIGVDMTDAMLERARANAQRAGAPNVEFRHGLLEALPVADASVDVVLSNCVINLCPDKPRVFREAFRVLRPGGRLVVSDIVVEAPVPAALRGCGEAWAACIGGATSRDEYLAAIRAAGFQDVRVEADVAYGGIVDLQTPAMREAAARVGLGADEVARALAGVRSLRVVASR